MKLDLVKKIIEVLSQNPGQKFTASQIAKWVFDTYPDICEAKRNRSKVDLSGDDDLIRQLTAEVSSWNSLLQKRHHEVKITEERPRKYYYSTQSDSDEVEQAETDAIPSIETERMSEHDLYPILSSFLWAEYAIYSKRIDEKRSSNSRGAGGNKWLYPDLVAMEDLTTDWEQKVKDCVQQYSDKKTKLWSFEVKLLINRSNVREAFFQAVSNSSWANYGYLVAPKLANDAIKELRILSALHGIGFILLNAENPAESQLLIPAKERAEVDWNTANRLVEENSDFKDFIEEITYFYQTGKIKLSDWDIDES